MKKCKNTECENLIDDKRMYCSLKCRNIYVNKNLRNYDKVKEIAKNKRDLAEIEYLKNPKKCLECDKLISYDNKHINFCDHSCSAKFNNKNKKGLKYNISEKGKKSLIESAYKNLLKSDEIKYTVEKNLYYENPKLCLNCNENLEYNRRNKVFCNINCKNEYHSKNKNYFELYYVLSKFKFSLNKYEDFDFSLIEKYGWYKAKNNGDNVGGVSRDHMFSVKEGFRQLINPLLISHPANCELIINRQNQSKNDECSLTLEKLLEKIKLFEDKYGVYYEKYIKTYIDLNELKEIYMGL